MTVSRRIAIALLAAFAISIAANIFFVGFQLTSGHRGPSDRIERLAGIGGIGDAPPDVWSSLQGVFADRRPQIREAFGAVREARRAVRDTMRREPFDRAALDSAYAELRSRSDTLLETVFGTVAEGVERAPAEARAEIRSRRGD